MNQLNQVEGHEANLIKWKLLYRIAGISSIVMLILIPIQIIIFSISLPPDSIKGWFELFHSNWFLGLIHLDLLYIIDNVLVAIMYLAFYFTLKQENESLMAIALLLGFLGIAAYFASSTAFEMLSVSKLYANAVTDTDRNIYIAVGQMMISSWQGTAFNIYYVLNGITLLMISSVMFKSNIYTNRTATVGLVAGILMVIPSTAGTVGLIFSLLSLIPWIVFTIMVSVKFLKLSKVKIESEIHINSINT
jgi:hypothetical protein